MACLVEPRECGLEIGFTGTSDDEEEFFEGNIKGVRYKVLVHISDSILSIYDIHIIDIRLLYRFVRIFILRKLWKQK